MEMMMHIMIECNEIDVLVHSIEFNNKKCSAVHVFDLGAVGCFIYIYCTITSSRGLHQVFTKQQYGGFQF